MFEIAAISGRRSRLMLFVFNVVAVLRIIPRYRVNVAGGKLLSLPECHGIGGTCILSKDST